MIISWYFILYQYSVHFLFEQILFIFELKGDFLSIFTLVFVFFLKTTL